MLERLQAEALPGSEESHFARLHLAEILVETSPWRAATLARSCLQEREDDRSWAVLGLAMALLGHFRSAVRGYRKALALNPGCTSYAHNLGHLYDMALDDPRGGLEFLRAAFRADPMEAEIAASYAHALLRTGQREPAEAVLRETGRCSAEIGRTLDRWLARAARPCCRS